MALGCAFAVIYLVGHRLLTPVSSPISSLTPSRSQDWCWRRYAVKWAAVCVTSEIER
jgi:hypothetical protein